MRVASCGLRLRSAVCNLQCSLQSGLSGLVSSVWSWCTEYGVHTTQPCVYCMHNEYCMYVRRSTRPKSKGSTTTTTTTNHQHGQETQATRCANQRATRRCFCAGGAAGSMLQCLVSRCRCPAQLYQAVLCTSGTRRTRDNERWTPDAGRRTPDTQRCCAPLIGSMAASKPSRRQKQQHRHQETRLCGPYSVLPHVDVRRICCTTRQRCAARPRCTSVSCLQLARCGGEAKALEPRCAVSPSQATGRQRSEGRARDRKLLPKTKVLQGMSWSSNRPGNGVGQPGTW